MKKFCCQRKVEACYLCFLSSLLLMSVSIFFASCKMTAEGIISVSDNVKTPVLLEFSQKSVDSLSLYFSKEVELSDLEVRSGNMSAVGELIFSGEQIKVEPVGSHGEKQVLDLKVENQARDVENQGFQIQVIFTEIQKLYAGESYIFSGVAHDQEGNSLSFQVPFNGFNERVAGVVLSEVRTEASNADKENAKIEYVELYVHTPGNLAGISLSSAIDEKKYGEYVFPQVEVKKGEYILVHFRTAEEYKGRCIDETDSNLNASTAPDSCSDVRDFWVSGTSARLGKDDAIVLRQRSPGSLMDVLLYARSDISETARKTLIPVAQELVVEGGWSGGADISSWVVSDGLSTTKILARQNIAQIQKAAEDGLELPVARKEDWLVKSGATPGLANFSDK